MLDDNIINDLNFFTNIGMDIYGLYMRILKAYYVPAQIPDTMSPFLHRFFDPEDIKRLYCIKITVMYIVVRYNIANDILDNFNKLYNDRYDSHYENYKYNIDIQALLGVIKEICDTITFLREKIVHREALKLIDIRQREEIGDELQDLYTCEECNEFEEASVTDTTSGDDIYSDTENDILDCLILNDMKTESLKSSSCGTP